MSNKQVKVYSNPARQQPDKPVHYEPQWQVHGIDPKPFQSARLPTGAKMAPPSPHNPREGVNPSLRQPYATTHEASPAGRAGLPLNVGNNMEHSWAGETMIDDLSGEMVDPNQPMIDNNDFATDQAMGYQSGFMASNLGSPVSQGKVVIEEVAEKPLRNAGNNDLLSVISDLEEDQYLLMIEGVPVCSGPREYIEEQAHQLAWGEHSMCDGSPVPIDDMLILKRAKIKVGLFLA
jgi:hypothetical protein